MVYAFNFPADDNRVLWNTDNYCWIIVHALDFCLFKRLIVYLLSHHAASLVSK